MRPQSASVGRGDADMATWSTDSVDARERFSFWREVVCRTILNVATESPREEFRARITGRSFGALRFAVFHSTSFEIVRNRQHVAHAPEDHYLVSLQLRGESQIVQGDDAFALRPNEIGIVDGRRPFRIGFPKPVSRIVVAVPHEMIDQRAPWLRNAGHRKILPSSPFADLTRRHLLQLAVGEDRIGETEANLLADNLCNLLALSSGRDVAASTPPPKLPFEALLTFCRQNLNNPDLSPGMVAARFGISLRTLHSRFGQAGHTFGRWVLASRLDGCSEALRDPGHTACSISEVAYRWGFNDLSHFNKAFRARQGMTPSQWRHAALP
jgi:AraC family transcriptional regulator, positive regulator of tynA and feaB